MSSRSSSSAPFSLASSIGMAACPPDRSAMHASASPANRRRISGCVTPVEIIKLRSSHIASFENGKVATTIDGSNARALVICNKARDRCQVPLHRSFADIWQLDARYRLQLVAKRRIHDEVLRLVPNKQEGIAGRPRVMSHGMRRIGEHAGSSSSSTQCKKPSAMNRTLRPCSSCHSRCRLLSADSPFWSSSGARSVSKSPGRTRT